MLMIGGEVASKVLGMRQEEEGRWVGAGSVAHVVRRWRRRKRLATCVGWLDLRGGRSERREEEEDGGRERKKIENANLE